MKNFYWCSYTLRHRRALRYLTEKLVADPALKEEMIRRAEIHDMDKIVMYQHLDVTESQLWHIHHQPHHPESGRTGSEADLLEMVLDYESAPYTKPDKPLNAWDFTHLLLEKGFLEPQLAEKLFQVMQKLGIAEHRERPDDLEEALAFIDAEGPVTEERIRKETERYLEHMKKCGLPVPELEFIRGKETEEQEERTEQNGKGSL